MSISNLELFGPLTTAERDALVANSFMPPYTVILNSDSGQLEYWDTPFWKGVLGANIAVSGDVNILGTLGVGGVTSLSSLNVIGATDLQSNVTVIGNALVGGTLGVSGATSLGALTAGGTNVTGSLTVNVNALVGGTLGVSGATSLGALVAGGTNVTGSLTVDVNAVVLGTLGVSGGTALAALTAGGTNITGSLTVDVDTVLLGTLGVTGATSLGALTATGSAALQSTLAVTGAATLNSTLGVDGLLSASGSIRLAAGTGLQNISGIPILTLPGSADALRIIYPTLIGADADPAAGVTLEVRGKELVTTEIEIDGALNHDGANVGFYGTAPATQQTATGSRGGNAALASLLTALAATGLIVDSTT